MRTFTSSATKLVTKIDENMKTYNYFYNGQAISRDQFISAVPANWESEVDEYGNYSYGYYRAVERDENRLTDEA